MRDYAFYSLVLGLILYIIGYCRNVTGTNNKIRWGWFIIGGPLALFGLVYAVVFL